MNPHTPAAAVGTPPSVLQNIFACIIGEKRVVGHRMFHLAEGREDARLVFPFWVLQYNDHTVLVDTGFPADIASARGIENHRDPKDALERLGIDPLQVSTVIVSHLHFDHFCAPERFPQAEFIVQRDDVDYFVGRGRNHPITTIADDASLESLDLLRREGRLRELSGDALVEDGLRVLHVPGHTPGSQIVVVDFGGSVVVLACDASHFYENLETSTPSAIMYSYDGYQRGFGRILASAGSGRWFPGHDPRMLDHLRNVGGGVYEVLPQ